jgi:hypothetical protein
MTERSLINDPNDFVPRPPKRSKWAKWFEGGEPLTSVVSEAIDYVVDFEVKESARDRADRIWGMDQEEFRQWH